MNLAHIAKTVLSVVAGVAISVRELALAAKADPSQMNLTPTQQAAYDLAHALRNTFAADWAGAKK